jgi:hypothetical protein
MATSPPMAATPPSMPYSPRGGVGFGCRCSMQGLSRLFVERATIPHVVQVGCSSHAVWSLRRVTNASAPCSVLRCMRWCEMNHVREMVNGRADSTHTVSPYHPPGKHGSVRIKLPPAKQWHRIHPACCPNRQQHTLEADDGQMGKLTSTRTRHIDCQGIRTLTDPLWGVVVER